MSTQNNINSLKQSLTKELGVVNFISPSRALEIVNLVNDVYETAQIQDINENVSAQGFNGNTTAKLDYGINVITSANVTNFAIRLPFPPVKGRTVTIINTSGIPLIVYPSVSGGSINGVVNGTATIPSDNNAYTFTCWENPLPGAWSWTPPATNQYDSGDVTFNCTGIDKIQSIINNAIQGESNTFSSSTGWGFDCLNTSNIIASGLPGSFVAAIRPSPSWSQITRIKVYSNILTGQNPQWGLMQGSTYNAYGVSTGALVGTVSGGSAGNYAGVDGSYKTLGSVVPGTPAVGALSANVGDPGTKYGIMDYTNQPVFPGSGFGNIYVGQETVNSQLCNIWVGRAWQMQIQSNAILTGVKYRFFIEYN